MIDRVRALRSWHVVALLALALVSVAALTGVSPRPHAEQPSAPTVATPANDFLNSIGTQSGISARGENLNDTIKSVKYLGVRWMRGLIESDVPVAHFARLHEEAGVRFSWGFGSGHSDIEKLLRTGREVEAMGALIAFEGPNEPNNWSIVYEGQEGGRTGTWLPVAKLMRDLYRAVKDDPVLRKYPVWMPSQNGAQTDNVGLQFLKIPPGANTLMPDGTQFADYANVHNYIYHPGSPKPKDNKTWLVASPGTDCDVDCLYGHHGLTWAWKYKGYSDEELLTLPRVSTETGASIGDLVSEDLQGKNLLNLYLAQFKRGWAYTANYLLRDRIDEAGNQTYGYFTPQNQPRKSADYLHNFTRILADPASIASPEKLDYRIANQPDTVHDLLLQKNDRTFALVVWNERLEGKDTVTINLGETFAWAKIYDPTVGQEPVKEIDTPSDSLTLDLSDHPVVIVLPAR